jgi:hypothetical protein
MNGLSILIVSILLGVLVVAGIKAIISEIKSTIQDRKIKVLLENDFELFLKADKLQKEILEKIAK